MSLMKWAFSLAEEKLSLALPRRWAHVQGVARKACSLNVTTGLDAEMLQASAILHDIGYAPDLAQVGFHPIDGARFLRSQGAPTRLVSLVAHHSCAIREARLRGIESQLHEFSDEGETNVRDALWCCDITTTPDGHPTSAQERIKEIVERYGDGSLVARFITEAEPDLFAAVERTESRMREAQLQLGQV